MFVNSGGIGYISRHLRIRQNGTVTKRSKVAGASVQQLYELCFCMWTLTYDCNTSGAVRTHVARDHAVAAMVDLVNAAPREKVVRVALSALRNLATCTTNASLDPLGKRVINGSYFLTEMIGCGLLNSIDRMKSANIWTDPDIAQGMNVVVTTLRVKKV
jgi:V-type H+-transporting ATPase subunit H